MTNITGLSGNEILCLAQKGFKAGNLVIGNSVYSLGILGSLGSSFKAMMGGEVTQITKLLEEGRESAYKRMINEADSLKATGITGATTELIYHSGNVEFLSQGSIVHATSPQNHSQFSTSANGQALFAQLDAGYKPICFSFGNVAYSLGLKKELLGTLKTLGRGEVKEYSAIFKQTRHLALERITEQAKKHKANAVIGITTNIIPFEGVNEMIMTGTASSHPQIASAFPGQIVTSDMTNIEMWSMANMGYAPMRLLLGTSVFSLGLAGGISSTFKSLARGEINELTTLIYEAREIALGIIKDEATAIGADDVVGTKLYVYGFNGLIEFLAIGTAVKKIEGMKTESAQLPSQAIVVEQDTFYDSTKDKVSMNLSQGSLSGSTQDDSNSFATARRILNNGYTFIKYILLAVAIIVVLFYYRISWNKGLTFTPRSQTSSSTSQQ